MKNNKYIPCSEGSFYEKINKKLKILSFSSKDLKKNNKNIKIIGYFDKKSSKIKNNYIKIEDKEFGVYNIKKTGYKIISYIKVGEGEYICYTKFNFIIILLFIVLYLAFMFLGFKLIKYNSSSGIKFDKNKLKFDTNQIKIENKMDNQKDISPGTIDFFAYKEYKINKETNYCMPLYNPGNNHVFFQFEVFKENGDLIKKTDLINPGNCYWLNLKNTYKLDGNYIVYYKVSTYDVKTLQPSTTQTTNNIIINIKY